MLKQNLMSIPMASPDLTEAEYHTVNDTIHTPVLSIGPRLETFENQFARYTGTQYAVGVNSGTSGLHLTMIAAGIEEGAIVITTPFSFIASSNCVLYERGIPVFVDVEPVTGNINPALVAEAAGDLVRGGHIAQRWLPPALRATNGTKKSRMLKAVLPVHTFGQPADMEPLVATARQHNLSLIEDACEAIGAEYNGRRAGTFGDAAVFAFYPNKQMTTGEGGMIVTNNETWTHLFRSLRNQGRDVFNTWLSHTRLGYNYRLDEMSAALGVAQLQRIDELLAKRAQVARWYNERLAEVPFVEIPQIAETTTRMSWFVYVVRLQAPVRREAVMQLLAEKHIPSRPYFSPIHLQPFYRDKFGYQPGDFPVTEHLGRISLALPFSGIMTETQVDYVCEALKTACLSPAAQSLPLPQ